MYVAFANRFIPEIDGSCFLALEDVVCVFSREAAPWTVVQFLMFPAFRHRANCYVAGGEFRLPAAESQRQTFPGRAVILPVDVVRQILLHVVLGLPVVFCEDSKDASVCFVDLK